MELVSDAAGALRALLGAGVSTTHSDSANLDGELGAAWRAVTESVATLPHSEPPDRRLFRATAKGPLAALGGPLLVQAYAPYSQFVRLQQILAGGGSLPDGLACLALDGARFRGQRGRAWSTHPGNLHLSVHLTLDLPADRSQAGLSVLPAVAAARAVEAVSEERVQPRLKWVNDLLLGRAKVGGVLSASQIRAGRLRHVVLGIGLNVAVVPSLPADLRVLPATRLADHDPVYATEDGWAKLLPQLVHELAEARRTLAAAGSEPLVDAYRQRAAFLGRNVTIWPVDDDGAVEVDPIARGRVLELLPDLALVIESHAKPVRHGRMTIDDADGPGPARTGAASRRTL